MALSVRCIYIYINICINICVYVEKHVHVGKIHVPHVNMCVCGCKVLYSRVKGEYRKRVRRCDARDQLNEDNVLAGPERQCPRSPYTTKRFGARQEAKILSSKDYLLFFLHLPQELVVREEWKKREGGGGGIKTLGNLRGDRSTIAFEMRRSQTWWMHFYRSFDNCNRSFLPFSFSLHYLALFLLSSGKVLETFFLFLSHSFGLIFLALCVELVHTMS